jgi:hypothetical protein
MSVKDLIKERSEKRKLLSEIKLIILKDPQKKLKDFKKMNVKTIDDILGLFINIGNMAYFSGDNDTFEFFMDSLFDVIHMNLELDREKMIKCIYNYGLLSAHNHDIIPYSIILNNFRKTIFELTETITINNYLRILKDLALNSEINNYELGVMDVLNVFKDLYDHFLDKNMHVNRLYLQNIVISLISSSESNHHERLKNTTLIEAKKVLEFEPIKARLEASEVGSIQSVGESEAPNPKVL